MDDFDQSEKLKEKQRKIHEMRIQQLNDDLKDLIDESKTTDCSERIKTMLTPVKDWKKYIKDTPEWKNLIYAYKKSKDVNFQLLGVLVTSAFIWHKPAFLLSQSILNALLEGNKLIKRQTISGTEFGAFIAFAVKNGFLNIELEAAGHKKARLFSLKGALLNVYGAYAYDEAQEIIKSIKTGYIETENKKYKKPITQETPTTPEKTEAPNDTAIPEDDLAIVEKVMSLSHRFNDYEKEIFPEIAEKVKKYGAFKGKQKKLCINFLKNKWNY